MDCGMGHEPASSTRRTFLVSGALGAAALAASCERPLARRYFGWLFMASASERAIAVADLARFRRVASIALPQAPAQVIRAGSKAFVTCPHARAIFEIDTDRHRLARRIDIGGLLAGAAPGPGGEWIAAITDNPAALHMIDTSTARVVRRLALPRPPGNLDVTS